MGLASSRLWRLRDDIEAAGRPFPAVLGAVMEDIRRAASLLETREAS